MSVGIVLRGREENAAEPHFPPFPKKNLKSRWPSKVEVILLKGDTGKKTDIHKRFSIVLFNQNAGIFSGISFCVKSNLGHQVSNVFSLESYKFPLNSCSLSIASNSALKFPLPKEVAPLR